jgi:hypothetical protein
MRRSRFSQNKRLFIALLIFVPVLVMVYLFLTRDSPLNDEPPGLAPIFTNGGGIERK